MILKIRQNYLSLTIEQKIYRVAELHMIRDALREKHREKKKRTPRPKKLRQPSLMSPKMLAIFDKMPEDMKVAVLYGKK